ncbi:hypothetical protein BLA29_011519, partial [Euroglyphus maynei]
MCTIKDSSSMDENDFTSLDNIISFDDPMEVTKLLYDRYIQRKQTVDSLQSKTMTMSTETSTDDFQKEIIDEIRKLNVAFKQIQMAVDNIPAKIEQAIKSFHYEQQNLKMDDDDDDNATTMISDDIEILDYIRN